jgi:pimeloyl-ACP methyl ester carboxylesterase
MFFRSALTIVLAIAPLFGCPVSLAQERAVEPLGQAMEGFPYPHPVEYFTLSLEGRKQQMAYMHVAPAGSPNGRTALLFHGRNFGGYYWENTIRFLAGKGFHVVVPDQIGFGKSSKPDLALSFHAGADHTRQLLDHLKVDKVVLIAHSMGSMFGVRFALMFPDRVERLVLEGPIGLEDYRLKVPYAAKEELAKETASQSREAIDRFYRGYFAHWKPEYQVFADVAWRWNIGPDADLLARVAAQTYRMAYEQPVVYELPRLRMPGLIVGGSKDRSAIGRNRVSPEVRDTMGRFAELVPAAAAAIPDGRGVLLDDVGHIPHLEAEDRFQALLLEFLDRK